MSKRSHRRRSRAWKTRINIRRLTKPPCSVCGAPPWWKIRHHKGDDWIYYCKEHKPNLGERKCVVCGKQKTPWHITGTDVYLCHKHKRRPLRKADIPARTHEVGGEFGGVDLRPKPKPRWSQESVEELKDLWGKEIEQDLLAAHRQELQEAIDKEMLDGLVNVKPMTDPIGGISHYRPKAK